MKMRANNHSNKLENQLSRFRSKHNPILKKKTFSFVTNMWYFVTKKKLALLFKIIVMIYFLVTNTIVIMVGLKCNCGKKYFSHSYFHLL